MNKRTIVIVLVVSVMIFIGASWVVPQSNFLMALVEHMHPGVLPANSIARNLDSDNREFVINSLAILTDRKDPIAVGRALELLQSTDDYIWLNAAHYAGACGRDEAVPYLIKALRHTAWRGDNEIA